MPNDNIAMRFVHLLAKIGSNSIHEGISSLSLTAVNHIQTRDIKNNSADAKCNATLQCRLSSLTVTYPKNPCHPISRTEIKEANLTSFVNSSSFLISNQFSMTKGPNNAPANNL